MWEVSGRVGHLGNLYSTDGSFSATRDGKLCNFVRAVRSLKKRIVVCKTFSSLVKAQAWQTLDEISEPCPLVGGLARTTGAIACELETCLRSCGCKFALQLLQCCPRVRAPWMIQFVACRTSFLTRLPVVHLISSFEACLVNVCDYCNDPRFVVLS